MTVTYDLYYNPPHCHGCQCFYSTATWPQPNIYTIPPVPYQPKHRKPGPAQ